jgi:hypothetical protein
MKIEELNIGDFVWECRLNGEIISGKVTLISDNKDYVLLDNNMNKIVTDPYLTKEYAVMSTIRKLTEMSDSYRRSINVMTGKMHQCNKAIRELFKTINLN